jgi:hypothetical protein
MKGFSENELLTDARVLAAGINDAIAWVVHPANDKLVGERRSIIEKDLRRSALKARRLAEAATRPMAVAVFGPSQVGKSHLISVLARRGNALLVDFPGGDKPVDYIRQINPDQGREATGLVSRFTLRKYEAPAGFPVALQLLGPADIVKVLANSYFFEGNPSRYETFPKHEEIHRHVEGFLASAGAGLGTCGLAAEDVWDISEYLERYVPESELTKGMRPFWEAIAAIAGGLSIERSAELWSILWGRHPELTRIFADLIEAHAKLDFASVAFCPLAALDATDRKTPSILDVESLLHLGMSGAPDITVSRADGKQVRLPRPVITALTAEVRFVLTEKPWDFFEHTDLLDFPGYRGRGLEASPDSDHPGDEGVRGLAYHLKHNPNKTLQEMMLRGKVEYLFQRYMAEQDITAMLLCVKESNMDVKKLPDVVAQWVASTHGNRAQERTGKPTLLFFIFTRFDVHFDEKTSDSTLGLEARFEGRVKASLTDPFGKSPESWVQKWTPSDPFTNCFLMRNPNTMNKALFTFDGEREASILAERERFTGDLRAAFCSVGLVRRHFPDPGLAFDEMMRLNDGGATHIAKHLAPVCREDMKPRQVRDRLDDLGHWVTGTIAPFYVPTDLAGRVAARDEVAQGVIEELYRQPIEHARFGMFLRGLILDPADLYDRLYESLMRRPTRSTDESSEAEANLAMPPVAAGSIPLPFKRPATAAPRTPLAEAAVEFRPGASLQSRSTPQALARSAMRIWLEQLYGRASDPLFSRDVLIASTTMREIVAEIAKAAHRHGLLEMLVQDVEQLKFIDRLDERLAKTTVAVEHRLNQFIADLGFGFSLPGDRPVVEWDGGKVPVFENRPVQWDISGVGSEPRRFRDHYIADWLHALYRLFLDNARSEAGVDRHTEQNEKLGKILSSLRYEN